MVQVGVLDHDLKCMKDLVVEVTLTLDHVQPELGMLRDEVGTMLIL